MKKSKILSIFLILLLEAGLFAASGLHKAHALALSAPKSLKAEINQGHIALSWVDNAEAFSYTVIEKSVDQGNFTPIATFYKGTTTYRDYGVSNGHVYAYRAKVYGGSVSGPYSAETESVYIYPAAFNITRTLSSQVDLEWSYPALPLSRPLPYETLIERRMDNESSWTLIYTAPPGVTSFRDSGVFADALYYYRIKTRFPNGTFSYAIPNDSGLSTRTAYPLSTSLSGYALSDAQIKLEWDTSLLGGGRIILQKQDSAGNFSTLYTTDTESSYIDSAVTRGKTYFYRLYMQSKNGMNSDYTEEISVTAEPVPFPSDLTATAMSSNVVVLSWVYPYEVETGFEIWRKDSGFWQKIGTTGKNADTFTDTGVEQGKSYTYRVRAARGETAFSAFTQSKTVDNTVPPAPKQPVFYTSGGFLFIYSAEDVPSNAVYTLEYRDGINSEWKEFKTCTQGTLIARVVYSAYSEYYFRIRSNTGNLASYSPEFHFYGSAPDAAQGFKAAISGYGRIVLAWKDSTFREDGYRIYRTSEGSRLLIGTVDRDVERFIDAYPPQGAVCRYELVAFNASGESRALSISLTVPKKTYFKDISSYKWAHDAIYKLLSLGAVTNTQNGCFYPQKTLTRGEFTHMLLNAFDICHTEPYYRTVSDVAPGNPYYDDIMTAVSLGLIHPDAKDRLHPDSAVTRGEIAGMLANLLSYLGLPLHAYSTDVLAPYRDYELLAAEDSAIIASFVGDGIISGKAGQLLSLSSAATKVEGAAMLYRTLIKYKP